MSLSSKLILCIFLFPLMAQGQVQFPESYDQARATFLKNVQEREGVLSRFKVPSKVDDDLTMDSFYIPAKNSQKLVIIAAGVHGSEGPAGSVGLDIYLKDYAKKYQEQGLSVLLLHSVNPYGQKYGRRVTENNVDLNRNFSVDDSLYKTPNPSYHRLKDILNPTGPLRSTILTSTRATLGLLRALTLRGISIDEIRQASVGGQYEVQKGIYFGGYTQEPQVLILENYLRKKIEDYSELLILDIHTGLGERGALYLISNSSQRDREEELMRIIFPHEGDETYELTTANDPGFYPTTGDFTDYFHQLAPSKTIISVTVEFGTLGLSLPSQIQTINRLIAENQLYHYGARTERIRTRVQDRFEDLFNPQDEQWRSEVKRRIRFLYDDALTRFVGL